MLSAIGSIFSQFLHWIGQIASDLVLYSTADGTHQGIDFHPNSLFSNFIVFGLAASLIMFSTKIVRKVIHRF